MNRLYMMAPAVLLSLALGGCTAGTQAAPSPPPSSAAANIGVSAEVGQDLGNGRPTVTHDGLMVRRRVVIAVHPGENADLGAIRKKLDAAAASRATPLSAIAPGVLEPALLQHIVPELMVVLPASATLEDARGLVDQASGDGADNLGVEHFHVIPVLVHDLRFSLSASNPTALSAAIDREGILTDTLGNYDTAVKAGELDISYTGPLLGDELVETVRSGIARQAHIAASGVAVSPRSGDGAGVDMAKEPPWDPELLDEGTDHTHAGG